MSRRALSLVLGLYAPALPLGAQGLSYEGGVFLSSGRYIFTERTTSWSFLTGLTLDHGRLSVRTSLPVHLQNTSLVSLSGPGGRMPSGGPSSGLVADTGAARKRHSGTDGGHTSATASRVAAPPSAVTGYEAAIGDPTAEVAWRPVVRQRTTVTLSLMTKVPVADTASFGTGEWDLATSVAVSQTLGRRGIVGLNLTYWKLGDLPTLDFRDPVYGSGSFSYLAPNGWGGGLTISAGTSSLSGYSGPVWAGGSILRVSRVGSWVLAGAVGLSETTPDLTVSLTWKLAVISL